MSTLAFVVQMDEEEYRIVGPGGEEGATVPYGQPASLSIDEAIYYTLVTEPDEEDDPIVFHVDSASECLSEQEDVKFTLGDEPAGGPTLVETENDGEEEGVGD
jgi:hypothetical protein